MPENTSQLKENWNNFASQQGITLYVVKVTGDLLEATTGKMPFTSSGELEIELSQHDLQLVSEGLPDKGKYPITVKLKS